MAERTTKRNVELAIGDAFARPGRGEMEELGGRFYAVNVACLDDATDEELAKAPVTYENGRNDRWDQAPAETRHL